MKKQETQDFNTQLVEAKLSDRVMTLSVDVPWNMYWTYCTLLKDDAGDNGLDLPYSVEEITKMPKIYADFQRKMVRDYQNIDWEDKAEDLTYELEGESMKSFSVEYAAVQLEKQREKQEIERKAMIAAAEQAAARKLGTIPDHVIELGDAKKHKTAVAILKAAGLIK